jgi:hypothetical protein
MRTWLTFLLWLGVIAAVQGADAVNGRVLKVLPFLVDTQGRIAESPSLYDRDAYQAYLRLHTNEISGMRFDVLWKADRLPGDPFKIDVELRGIGTNNAPRLQTLETNVAPGKFRQWTAVPFNPADYHDFGTVTAWRVTLWDGGKLLGQQQSFLW